ncbi:DUF262 domain-containing protein [Actinomycetospora sp. NBC_00405]|uniref:DUF262 domain-containing protein n=1 Tax=Actinomycetospora sp. NBC_00405 TaxID=2975952 RepID=UPI002E1ECE26
MQATARTPSELFDTRLIYEIPTFQRPYVWNEEDQWQPLWDDVVRVAEAILDADDDETIAQIAPHFLGAVVIKNVAVNAGDIQRFWVIDGQQRLTTLQIVLDAAALVVGELGREDDAERLEDLVLNSGKRFARKPERFKIRPSRVDRVAFEAAMDDDQEPDVSTATARIVSGHEFFRRSITEWAGEKGEPGDRLGALVHALRSKLAVVSILLGEHDDEQLIFETINDRGTPLLGADLIKNFVFRTGDQLRADVDRWNDEFWRDLDDDWWRELVSQGRLYRSRIDIFLQYWLTMRTHEEVPAEQISSHFQNYAKPRLVDIRSAETFLAELRRDADAFRDFAQMGSDTARGRFYSLVIESLQLGTTTPLLLWLISSNHRVPAEQIDRALAAAESWVVRRMLLRRTTKDVNKAVVALLAHLDAAGTDHAGDATIEFLGQQTTDTRVWPSDDEIREELPALRAYGSINQARLRLVLAAVERHWRSTRQEDVSLPTGLQVEHIMPRNWRTHWGDDVVGDPEGVARRDRLVETVGNLTLVTQRLNGTLSNRPWLGTEKHPGKRDLLSTYSLLELNKRVIELPDWTEADIRRRGEAVATAVTEMWPRSVLASVG